MQTLSAICLRGLLQNWKAEDSPTIFRKKTIGRIDWWGDINNCGEIFQNGEFFFFLIGRLHAALPLHLALIKKGDTSWARAREFQNVVLSLIKVITCQEPSQNLHIMNVCMYLSSMSHGKSDFVCKHQTWNETMLKYGPTQNETMLKCQIWPNTKLYHAQIWQTHDKIMHEPHISLWWFQKHPSNVCEVFLPPPPFFLKHDLQKHISFNHPHIWKECVWKFLNIKVE